MGASDYRLKIELVPATSWGNNLRGLLKRAEWDKIRKKVYALANYKCEICGGVGKKHPVECHEKWCYDDVNHTQTLVGLIALCPKCHGVCHIGNSLHTKRFPSVFKHFMAINNISEPEAQIYLSEIFQIWESRSNYEWNLDVLWLGDFVKTLNE